MFQKVQEEKLKTQLEQIIQKRQEYKEKTKNALIFEPIIESKKGKGRGRGQGGEVLDSDTDSSARSISPTTGQPKPKPPKQKSKRR